jgi:hypothetical protein
LSRKRRRTPEDGASEYEVAQDKLRREAAQLRRLGGGDRLCIVCGEADPEMLTLVDRTLIEDDHLLGRHEGPKVPLCLNHHAKRTALQMRAPSRLLAPDRTEIERIAALLDFRAEVLGQIASVDKRMARFLLELSKRIQQDAYRDIPSPFTGRNQSES